MWPGATSERILGRLSLVKQCNVLFMAWLPYSRGVLQEDGTFRVVAAEAGANGGAGGGRRQGGGRGGLKQGGGGIGTAGSGNGTGGGGGGGSGGAGCQDAVAWVAAPGSGEWLAVRTLGGRSVVTGGLLCLTREGGGGYGAGSVRGLLLLIGPP